MYESLMEEVVKEENRMLALAAVKRNHGAPGIDHMKTTELESHLQAHWERIRMKLLAGTWVPSPVRRVEIPKPSGGTRMLGIPTVMDRLIQQMLLLSNIYLDVLDKELERRGHRFCRYADDCNIYVGSQSSAERTLTSIQAWIENHLRLKVNAAKSGAGRVWERKFLGFRLDRDRRIGVAPESIERFKTKVRDMWRGNQSRTSNELRNGWRSYVRGWWGYYRLAEARKPIFKLEGWIRRHIRKCFWLRWHNADGRENALPKLGVHPRVLKTVRTGRGAWFMANTSTMNAALKVKTLRRFGFLMPSDLAAT